MSEQDAESLLPRVTKDDIVTASLEKLLDPKSLKAFERLKMENPLLVNELRRRAYLAIHEVDNLSSVELLTLFIENALFPIQALQAAMIRQRQENNDEEVTPLLSGDVDTADPPPSSNE